LSADLLSDFFLEPDSVDEDESLDFVESEVDELELVESFLAAFSR